MSLILILYIIHYLSIFGSFKPFHSQTICDYLFFLKKCIFIIKQTLYPISHEQYDKYRKLITIATHIINLEAKACPAELSNVSLCLGSNISSIILGRALI